MSHFAIINTWLLSLADGAPALLEEGAVAVENGRITYAGPASDLPPPSPGSKTPREIIDGRFRATLPGFVNAHFHSSYSLLRGAAQDVPEIEWMNRAVAPLRRHLEPADELIGSRLAVLEGVRSGTTTFAELSARVAELVEAVYLPLGVRVVATETINEVSLDRAHLGPRDLYPFDRGLADEALARADDLFERFADAPLVSCMYGPQALDMISIESLQKARAHALERGSRLHLHLAQGNREQGQIQARYGRRASTVSVLARYGLLGEELIAAHGHGTNPAERERMVREGVRMVSCQSSIAMIDGIVPPLRHYLELGGTAALGTDQSPGPGSHSMLREMRTTALLAKVESGDPSALPPWRVLDLATRAGAAVLGLGERIGSLTAGRRADLITVRLDRLNLTPAVAGPIRTILPNLIYSTTGAEVDNVVIDGRFVLRDGRFPGVDEKALIQEANARARRLFRRAEVDWRNAASRMVSYTDEALL